MKHLGIWKIPLCDKTPVNNIVEYGSMGGKSLHRIHCKPALQYSGPPATQPM
jgi:hypothetical protein